MKFDEHMMNIGFTKSLYDSCVYLKKNKGSIMTYLLLYVNDMLVASTDLVEVEQVKSDLKIKFDMKDLGSAKRILGMDITRIREKGVLWLTQHAYIQKLLKRFRMNEAQGVYVPLSQHFKLFEKLKPSSQKESKEMSVVSYANAVGSVMYTMVCTRPDLAHSISIASRYMADPGKHHWEALNGFFNILKGIRI